MVTAGGATDGPDKSEGSVIVGNHVTRCENIGIGTASNGTVIMNNSVSDTGAGARTTYALLGLSGGRHSQLRRGTIYRAGTGAGHRCRRWRLCQLHHAPEWIHQLPPGCLHGSTAKSYFREGRQRNRGKV